MCVVVKRRERKSLRLIDTQGHERAREKKATAFGRKKARVSRNHTWLHFPRV